MKDGPEPQVASLLSLADQCVKCGYCLPHCPTFKLAHDEGESPRGRIALIQGWLGGEIADGPRLARHLDNCLECRACEPSCPSLVRYGALMDGARALREQRRPRWRRWLRRAALALLTRPDGLRLLALVGIGYRWLRLPRPWVAGLAKRWPVVRVLDPLARALRWPRAPVRSRWVQPAPACYASARSAFAPSAPAQSGSARSGSAGTAAAGPEIEAARVRPILFRGCVARLTDQPLEAAAQRLLARLGYPVEVPNDQVCCGAIHRHNGYPAQADQRLAINARRFGERVIIGLASACVAELREQGGLNAVEICRFLLDQPWPAGLQLRSLSARIAVHEPCSHRNQLRDQGAIDALLRRIPAATRIPLPGNDTCCGAAGTYLTEHPQIALALAEPKIEALRRLAPDYLVTTNTGCALHLAARLDEAGLAIPVLHPIQLIEQQLPIDPEGASHPHEHP
ncbi:MAG: (Fe-S)-binding protein [Halochromatium sp.]|uniref:(Fe-S)-binding protein n=1 Tax=Halochromatium sp. TaxID=2049430 RepID=UPI00397E08CB